MKMQGSSVLPSSVPTADCKSCKSSLQKLAIGPAIIFANAFASNDRRQSTANKLPAMFGNLWHCVFFADLHYTLCRQTGVCHNTEVDGKVVGNCLAIFFCTGIAGKVVAKLPP